MAGDATDTTIFQRMGDLEQQMHTVRYQLDELHKIPPRVMDLERAVDVMSASLAHIKQDNMDIKKGVKEIHDAQVQHLGDIKGMERTVKVATGLMGFAAVAAAVVLWLFAL